MVKKIEQELEEAKAAAKEKQILYENCVSTVSMLEKSIKEHDNNREGRLKDLEKKIKAVKVQMQSASKDLKVGFVAVESTIRLPTISCLAVFFLSLARFCLIFCHPCIRNCHSLQLKSRILCPV